MSRSTSIVLKPIALLPINVDTSMCSKTRDPRLKILVVHGDVPSPDGDACSRRLVRIIELLVGEGHGITLLARDGTGQERNSAGLLRIGVEQVHPLDPERLNQHRLDPGRRLATLTFDLQGLLTRGAFDLAWLSLFEIAEQYLPVIRRHSPATRIVLDSPDKAWLRGRGVYGVADLNVVAREVDARTMRGLAPGVRVEVVSLASARLAPHASQAEVHRVLWAACPVRWQARADVAWLDELLAAYAHNFTAGEPATLVLTVPADDPSALQTAFDRVNGCVAALGLELERIADIEITAWDDRIRIPARTLVFDASPGPAASLDGASSSAPVTVAGAALTCATGFPRTRRRPRLAVAVEAAVDPTTLQRQLDALQLAVSRDSVELVIAAFGHDPQTSALLDGGLGARVLRCDRHPGRELARRLAIEATSAPVLVALGPLALPQPGFLEPLLEAVERGASFAGAAIDGAHGLRVAADGSLWPLSAGHDGPVEALSYDCLAARREIWEQSPVVLPMREGHPERQLADWARPYGELMISPRAVVQRVDCGPISVIICTRNRAGELADGVALLAAWGATGNGNEVIVVDNGSTDGTSELAQELAATLPGVRVVFERRAGLSYARNAGAAAARHSRLCYLDDDARPAPGWRESMAWALTRTGIAAAAGPIAALWPPEREPGWPAPGLEACLSVLDGGDAVRVLVPPAIAYGANWAIQREALQAVGGFDAHLGYSPDRRIGGEEVAVAWRLHRQGLGGTLYVPGAAVGHRISPDRLRDSYLVEKMFAGGIEYAHLKAEVEGQGHDWMLAEASRAADRLFETLPLSGDLELEEALARVQSASLPIRQQISAAMSLGLLAATALLLDEREIEVGELRLRLRPEHLRGLLGPLPALTATA